MGGNPSAGSRFDAKEPRKHDSAADAEAACEDPVTHSHPSFEALRRRVEAAQSDFPTISNFTHHTSDIPRVKKALLWLNPLEVQQVKPSTGHPH